MALNSQVYAANPLKAKTIGLSDILRISGYSYTTLLTVLNSQTLKIEDGTFSIIYAETIGTYPIAISVYINISGLRIPLVITRVEASGFGQQLVNLKDVITTPITLKIGDTIFLEYVYEKTPDSASIGTGTGSINGTLVINDYQV